MKSREKIYVAGHEGLLGSALIRKLKEQGYSNIVTRTIDELDLRNQQAVNYFFEKERPAYVLLAAARVGGIKSNIDNPASFIFDNSMINANVIHASYLYEVRKLLFFGSACVYPRLSPQPIKEDCLLRGSLEKSNEPYALAKITGIRMCQTYNQQYGTNFICCIPTNLYGPNDNFDLDNSHVLPALLVKIYTAKMKEEPEVTIWGTGQQQRELLYVDDCADAALFLMKKYNHSHIINIGTGREVTIAYLAQLIKDIVGYKGDLVFDDRRPMGFPRRVVDVTRLYDLGWEASVLLEDGIKKTLDWCLKKHIFELYVTRHYSTFLYASVRSRNIFY